MNGMDLDVRAHDADPVSEAPQARWLDQGAHRVLSLSGDWRGGRGELPAPSASHHEAPGGVSVDAAGLRAWDVALAAQLWQRLEPLVRRSVPVDLQGLPDGLRDIVALSLNGTPAAAEAQARPGPGRLARLGAFAARYARQRRGTLTFVGEVLLSLGRGLRGASDMRAADLCWQIEQTGPRSLPIVALVSFLVGLILAYMGAAQLQRFGAQTYIADLVTVGVVREIAALMVGIVLSGRVGAAFAAQIGSMRANEEVDALSTLGMNPMDFLVLPRVLALLIVGPMLTAFAALFGMMAGWLVAVAVYDVTPLEYVYASAQALTLPHVVVGLVKGTVYAVLVALAGCMQGMAAGRSAQAVGDATTASVVQSIVWIVVFASVLTVAFQRLDF